MKVLVVDDVAANRMVLSALLKRLGHEVSVAGGVVEALTVMRESRPEIVLTDLHMPSSDEGVALARDVRKMPDGRSVRVALMTGDAASYVDSEGLFDVVLDKPVMKDDLLKFLGGVR